MVSVPAAVTAGAFSSEDDEVGREEVPASAGLLGGRVRQEVGNRSTTLIHSPPLDTLRGDIGSSKTLDSSSDLDSLSPVSSMSSLSASDPDPSAGAELASLPFLACPAALAPNLIPAQTPRATPPPISTADVSMAPWDVVFLSCFCFSEERLGKPI